MKNVIVVNNGDLEEKKKKIRKDGSRNFHVVTDFDSTLSKAYIKGKRVPSIISQIREDDSYLSPDYASQAKALYEKYHPIEINYNIAFKEKNVKMYEWWKTHFDLLIKLGLNKRDLERVVREGKIQPRKGVLEFLDFLHQYSIPLLIISSSGLGDAISMYLEKWQRLYNNIYIISNFFEWDKNGNAISVKEPIIHSMNKKEIAIKNYPIFKYIKNRENVLLLGDSIGDLGMVEGFDYKNLIKIGFLNDNVDEQLELFKENFDVVLLSNSDFDFINKSVKEIVK